MELTNLQRLGISSLLLELRKINPFVTDGVISFIKYNERFKMIIHETRLSFVFSYFIEENEKIDITIEYEFTYDGTNNIFRIVTINSFGGEC